MYYPKLNGNRLREKNVLKQLKKTPTFDTGTLLHGNSFNL